MLFKLNAADFCAAKRKADLAGRSRPAPRHDDINALSPDEWAIVKMVRDDHGGAVHGAEILARRMRERSLRRDWVGDNSGATAVEFALVAPVFLLLVCGIVVYGVWFSMALSVQSLATEGARASLAGIDLTEQRELALTHIRTHAPAFGLAGVGLTESVEVAAGVTRVTVRFDASNHPIMAMKGLIPSPPPVIERNAVVENGG